MKRVIRSNACARVKFSRGEGTSHIGVRTHMMKTMKYWTCCWTMTWFAHANEKHDCEIEALKTCGTKEGKLSMK